MKRGIIASLIAGTAMLAMAAPAAAHNTLVSSDPKDKTSLEAGPSTVTLTFDQPVQAGEKLNTVAVTDSSGGHYEAGTVSVSGNTVSAPVNALGAAGEYTVGYRILSADGHPVTGTLTFTLTKAGPGTPTKAPETQAAPQQTPAEDGGMPVWPWIVGAVVLLGGGVFFALRGGGAAK
ncbi:copper resistance protein C [Lentzea sp. NBRC 105346]|uniref:copper resistance CopC family protein n=1 Tax=Lentzea sp. NBRC 105346 TaxID=3032205 RepID=UPI0024A27BEE|nr:copper resistance CopC family protein [Lentzea sp. NBRC 105346]GLZ32643.1 copper resistance protein C [Lentzea sp. NBRC 105346]